MSYFDLVITDSRFLDLFIGGLLVFGTFGAWRFFYLYTSIVFLTFTDDGLMQVSLIVLLIIMVSHYFLATLSVLFSNEQKSPFKDVT